MRLLDRYLFRELLMPLAVCLIGFQSLIIFITVFTDVGKIQEAKLSFGQMIAYATAASMEFLTIVIPVALLLALLTALTSHARYNELTAMRAAGISLWRICVPYFIVGLIAAGAVFALNESVVPRCTEWASRALNHESESGDTVKSFAFTNDRARRKWVVRGDYRSGSSVVPSPWVTWNLPDGSMRSLTADRAVRTDGVWTFYNVQEFSQADAPSMSVPIMETNVLAMPEFDETPDEIAREIRIAHYFDIKSQNATIPVKDIVGYLQWHPNVSRADRGKLLTDLQERIAMPVTCIVVALIAIPFGAAPGRRNIFVGVAGSIFICLIYFVLQRVSLAFGSSGTWPAWLGAWLPNLFFGAAGLILMMRIR
ncbi:MAG TPA: LptF/LptG family permease [Candidatus Sulfotelmatobacter sp.]|nr:LptF/LptG family permease [Candidatus Sulfotelmatobacter sp.]